MALLIFLIFLQMVNIVSRLVPLLIESVKELKQEVEYLKKKVN